MVKINFGVSSYSRHAPGVKFEERVMEIPSGHALEQVGKERYGFVNPDEMRRDFATPDLGNYMDPYRVHPERFTLESSPDREGIVRSSRRFPAVRFDLASLSHDQYEMLLLWVEERSEWVAVEHHSFVESTMNIDEDEHGPYALDDYCRDMLRRAYGSRHPGSKDASKI